MSHQWNVFYFYVVLSICIAAVTSFFALNWPGASVKVRWRAWPWGPCSARHLGHDFVGMQAFVLPASVSYALPLTLISGACAVGFLIAASISGVSRPSRAFW